MPRATKLTDHVADQIVLAVRAAAAFKVAARTAGVGETTFYTWLARGRAERRRLEVATAELEALPKRARSEASRKTRPAARRATQPKPSELPFLNFADRIEEADAEAQVRASAQIAAAGAENWRAAAWFLERRDPEHFGPPQARVAVEGSHPGAPLAVVHTLDAQREISDAARDFLARIGEVERRDRVVAANGNGAAD